MLSHCFKLVTWGVQQHNSTGRSSYGVIRNTNSGVRRVWEAKGREGCSANFIGAVISVGIWVWCLQFKYSRILFESQSKMKHKIDWQIDSGIFTRLLWWRVSWAWRWNSQITCRSKFHPSPSVVSFGVVTKRTRFWRCQNEFSLGRLGSSSERSGRTLE